MQLAETFSTPSSNQRICRSWASKEVSLIRVKGLIQSSRAFAAAPKKAAGSAFASARIFA